MLDPCLCLSYPLDVIFLSYVWKAVHLVFISFSKGYDPYVAVGLMWLQEEVSSGSSCAAILDPPLAYIGTGAKTELVVVVNKNAQNWVSDQIWNEERENPKLTVCLIGQVGLSRYK